MCLRYAAERERTRPVFEVDGDGRRKMDQIRQYQAKTIVVEAQTVAKPRLAARKVLLCVWWDWKGIIHYELLLYGQTLNSTIYCEQLDRLKQAID
ncbi:Putative DD34D transposase [Caligus rogercresseyi]|uniref:DD34D transposase n=1 Tax=Caligus rogercresseyi TaxID=217165 RepID=A0A7T8HLU7_CALRO|nr:Putative DD34D transposase [Caligus rogercresseyi]